MKLRKILAFTIVILMLALNFAPMTVSADITGENGPLMKAAADTWDRSEGYADYAFDYDEDTIWHSLWNLDAAMSDEEFPIEDPVSQQDIFPQVLIVEFDAAYKFDCIGYLPRSGAGNGAVTQCEYWISTTGSLEDFHTDEGWTKIADCTWEWDGEAFFVNTEFDEVEAKLVKFVVLGGNGGWASAAEIQFGFTNVAYKPYAGYGDETTFKPRTTPLAMPWKPVNHSVRFAGTTTIKATDFDAGVYGKAPADGSKDIRPDEEVNTEVGESSFGSNIGWIAAGDWVQYTVNVQQDGRYKIDGWLASDADPTGAIKVYYDDKEVGTSPECAKNGWQAYDLYTAGEVDMTAGEHVIKVEFTGGVNFSALEISPVVAEAETEAPAADDNGAADNADNADVAGGDEADTTTTTAASSADDGDESNMTTTIIIVIVVIVVIVIAVVIVLAGKKKGKK